MVAKKSAAKSTTKATVSRDALKFNPDWIKDPVPIFRNFDKAILKEIAQAKRDFATRVNQIIKKGQR